MTRRHAAAAVALAAAAILAGPARASGQSLSQRGFVEGRLELYPQEGTTGAGQALADALFRQEAAWQPAGWLAFSGAFDARADRGGRVERGWSLDWDDRGALRPALSVRRLSAAFLRGGLRVEAGKQLVRWGRADVLNPTDRFAPRDFLEVVEAEFLPVTAGRVTWERGAHTFDAIASRFTPSRIPAAGTRWFPALAPPGLRRGEPAPAVRSRLQAQGAIIDAGAAYPSRAQWGARWNYIGAGFECSASFFDGFDHAPRLAVALDPAAGVTRPVRQYLPLRMVGGDAAWPLRWLTLKGEVGYFTSRDATAAEYGSYVIQAERQTGEWSLVGGYAGEFVTREASGAQFSPERGLAKTFLGRASYTIDVVRSLSFEGAVRRSGDAAYLEAEFSQAAGQHWRVTATGTLIRGPRDDFFGQFRENSNVRLTVRYSY